MSEQTQNNTNDLSIQDLAVMRGVIEIATERGTFKANEMAAVGIVFNKLDAFLKQVEEQQKKAAQNVAETQQAEEATEE